MLLKKNTASQKLMVFAFDTTNNTAKTGDAANITVYISKDWGAVTALGDTSATEMDATNAKGYYLVDITQTETNADIIMVSAKSSTANIAVVGAPAVFATQPATGVAAPTTAGRTITTDASGNVTLADGVSHGGTLGSSTATLALSRLSIVSQSSNTAAITATGNGTGSGVVASSGSGATGDGIQATSAATNGNGFALLGNGSGNGLKVSSTSGDAILTSVSTSGHGATFAGTGTTKHGINATGGATTSHGINATGGGVGHGILATSGGGATGDGIKAVAASTNGNGFNTVGVGTGAGHLTTGGATGHGMSAVGGATSGDGISAAAATSGHGLTTTGVGTTKHGINATGGSTSSDGIRATGGGTGHGVNAQSGSGATGRGINAVSNATNDHGINATGAGTGHGLLATSGSGATGNGITATAASTNGHGMSVTGVGTGSGILATAGSTGSGINAQSGAGATGNGITAKANSTNGHGVQSDGSGSGDGMQLTKGASGADLDADIQGTLDTVTNAGTVTGNVNGNVAGSVGSVTGNVGGNVTGSVGSVAAGGITASSIAADAIGASELAADAAAEIADAVWDEAMSGHTTLATFGQVLNALGARTGEINDGAATTTVFIVDGFTEATNNHFIGDIIIFTSGAALGQARRITAYTGATQTVTVAPALTDAPADNDDFVIIPFARVDVGHVNNVAQTATFDTIKTDTAAILEDTGTTLQAEVDGIQADTEDIQSRLPAALVGGRMDSDIGAKTGNVALSTQEKADVNAEVVDVVNVDVIADSVATDGSRPTMRQALLMLTRFLMERGVVSTTMTVYKEDGTTSNMTFTLDDDTNPTAITRAS